MKHDLFVSVLGLDVIGESLGLGELGLMVVVVVSIVLGADVVHLVDAAALGASLNGTLTGKLLSSFVSLLVPSVRGQESRTPSQLTTWESAGKPVQPANCSSPADRTLMGSSIVPSRLESRGRMSKMSTPSIFPRISRRSRPVACSRSVGTVPGSAPGPKRSSSPLTSIIDS